MYETKPYFYGTGRRKDSVARVRVYTGTGKITINDRDIDNYFGLETLKLIVRSPLVLLGLEGKYDVVGRVSGAHFVNRVHKKFANHNFSIQKNLPRSVGGEFL